MKILNVCLVVHNSPQTTFRDAIKGIASEYREYSWCEERDRGRDTSTGILQANQEFQPDVTFMQLQDPTVLQPHDAAAMTGKLIQWSGDVRQPLPDWYSNLGRVLDLNLFSNEADVNAMRERGCTAEYMDIGFDPYVFTPIGSRSDRWPEIVFLGSNFGDSFPLSQYRRDMVNLLSQVYPTRFKAYGHGWPTSPNTEPLIELMDEAMCYRSAKIAINLSHFDLERYSSDRLLRALGCGPLVLSHRYKGIEKDWISHGDTGDPVGHLVAWESFETLCSAIDYFLGHEEQRLAVASNGCIEAHAKHTWHHRINNELLPMIQRMS